MGLDAETAAAGIKCAWNIWGVCFVSPTGDPEPSIFGFSEFLAALALLVLVYTSTDTLYRFRIAVAPLPIYLITFISTIIIGGGTLLTDYWFSQQYPIPKWLPSPNTIRFILGGMFLCVVMMWTISAFISPPKFSRWNAKRFTNAMYLNIVRGGEAELQVVGRELLYSLKNIVRHAPQIVRPYPGDRRTRISDTAAHANSILLLMGDMRFCRQVARTTPGTAIVLLSEAVEQRKLGISLGQFYVNVTTEAILYKDSSLYHEDHWFRTGLIGHLKPFVKSAYEPFDLVESSAANHLSPFNIEYRVFQSFDAEQFEAYCRIVGVTMHSYVNSGNNNYSHSYAIAQAIGRISEGHFGIERLDESDPNIYSALPIRKLEIASSFVSDSLRLLDGSKKFPIGPPRRRNDDSYHQKDLIDQLAHAAFSLVHFSAYARGEPGFLWQLHYGTVWSNLFRMDKGGKHSAAYRRRLFRLLYDEITRMEEWPNYKGARIFGYCLNILGLRDFGRRGYGHEFYPLSVTVRSWAKTHYATLLNVHPEVAAACMFGSINYDKERHRLVKTYSAGLSREPAREFLDLLPARLEGDDLRGVK